MATIETRDEGHAAQRSYLEWLDGQDGAVDEGTARSAHRAGWLAGRDWARDGGTIDPKAVAAVAQGWRLVGCPHEVSCTNVTACAARQNRP